MNLKEIVPLEWRGQRVLTTNQLAAAYYCATNTLYGFKEKFVEGEHYFKLFGDTLKEFKARNDKGNFKSQPGTMRIWTKSGAKLQAELRESGAVLDIYKWLAENYFKQAAITEITTPAEEPSAETGLQIFDNEEFGTVRVAGDRENPKFCLADVCRSLDLRVDGVVARLKGDPITAGVISQYPIIDKLGRKQNANFVNEDGLYDVILDSRKPAAKKFRKWITSEVLPTLRKTGEYKIVDAPTPKQTPLSEIVEQVGATCDAIKRIFGAGALREGIALAKSIDMTSKYYDADLSMLNDFLPAAMHQVGHLTASMIGNKLGISAQAVNEKLKAMGLQYKDKKGNWILTDAGVIYGEMIPYVNKYSGHTGYCPMWNDSVLNLLDEPRLF